MSRERRKMHWLDGDSIACKQRRGRDDATSTPETWRMSWLDRCDACMRWLARHPEAVEASR